MALNATHDAFIGFAIDGQPKKIAQSANLWTLMRGNAADTDTPTVTLDFDFVWQVGPTNSVSAGMSGGYGSQSISCCCCTVIGQDCTSVGLYVQVFG